MKHWPLLLFLFLSSSFLFAQEEIKEGVIGIYTHQKYGGLVIRTNGWGGSYVKGMNKGAFKIRQVSYDFNFVKHEKEIKSYFQDPSARPYVFGKQNAMYNFKLNYGYKKVMAEKLRKSGVQVSYTWGLGPSLALLRPIYLEVLIIDPNLNGYSLSTEKFDPNKHYVDNNDSPLLEQLLNNVGKLDNLNAKPCADSTYDGIFTAVRSFNFSGTTTE
jgi:hypothetical protein